MSQLISIQKHDFQGRSCNAVDARELHLFLEVGRIFPSWINNRIKQYDFIEGDDFVVSSTRLGSPTSLEKTYIISIDMAKELCMVERNEKGRQARKYFIECEKKLREGPATSLEALQAAVNRMVTQERRLTLVESENSDDSFTSFQVSHIDKLIDEKYRAFGKQGWINGQIKKELKCRFFEIVSTRTYKEIPRKHFDEVSQYIRSWAPSGKRII